MSGDSAAIGRVTGGVKEHAYIWHGCSPSHHMWKPLGCSLWRGERSPKGDMALTRLTALGPLGLAGGMPCAH